MLKALEQDREKNNSNSSLIREITTKLSIKYPQKKKQEKTRKRQVNLFQYRKSAPEIENKKCNQIKFAVGQLYPPFPNT